MSKNYEQQKESENSLTFRLWNGKIGNEQNIRAANRK